MTKWFMTVLAQASEPEYDPTSFATPWLKFFRFLWEHPLVTLAGLTFLFWVPSLNLICGYMGHMSDGEKMQRIENAIAGKAETYTWKDARTSRRIAMVLTVIWCIALYLCLKYC